MHAVNLLPRQLAAASTRRSLQPLALVGAAAVPVVALVFVAFGYSSAHSTVASEKSQFDALQAQIAKLGGVTSVTSTQAAETAAAAQSAARWNGLISERTARRAELDDVLDKELSWDAMMRSVARILPSDVWLTQLSFQSPVSFGASSSSSSSSAAVATNATIGGYGRSQKSIALLLVRLRLLPNFGNVTLSSTSSSTIGSKAVVAFTVSAAIEAPAGAVTPTTPTPAPSTTTTTTSAG